ncbi:MAG: response regulator [Patescibacteria group bacterium]
MNEQKQTIMIVEDEILLLEAISKKLSLGGISTISCSSGTQAIDYLETSAILPDAIWLDFQLKDMDGIAFMHHLKQKERFTKIPVIVVSNSASEEKVKNMLALGVRKYLLKASYRLDELIPIIKHFIAEENSKT